MFTSVSRLDWLTRARVTTGEFSEDTEERSLPRECDRAPVSTDNLDATSRSHDGLVY